MEFHRLPAAVLVLAFVGFVAGVVSLIEFIGLTTGAFRYTARLHGADETGMERATAHGFIAGSLVGLAFLLIARL